MDKPRKSKVIVRVEFLDSTPYQKILGEYLKNSGEAKAIVLGAVSAQKMAMALVLSSDPKIGRQELECMARKNRREMLNHVSELDDFFALHYQIDLRSDRPQSYPIQNLPSPSPVASQTIAPAIDLPKSQVLIVNDEDDEDEDEALCVVTTGHDDLKYNF